MTLAVLTLVTNTLAALKVKNMKCSILFRSTLSQNHIEVLDEVCLDPLHELQYVITLIIFFTIGPNILNIFEHLCCIHVLETVLEVVAYCTKIHRCLDNMEVILVQAPPKSL